MIKLILRIASISIFIFSCKGNLKNNSEEIISQARIKTITESTYKVIDKFGESKKNLDSKLILKFDENGDTIENANYYSNGNLYFKHVYKYDKKNMVQDHFEGDLKLGSDFYPYTNTYRYDNKNNLIEEDGYSEKKIYRYNDKNKIEEMLVEHNDGSVYSHTNYKYDEKGNQIEESCYNYSDQLISKTTKEYDVKGNKLKKIYSKGEWHISGEMILAVTEKFNYKYNEQGVLIEETACHPNDSVIQNQIFNKNGNIILYTRHDSKYRMEYKYDEKSNLIQLLISQDNILYNKIIYKYDDVDSNGNWIKQTKFDNDKPVLIIERKIEYY